MTTLRVIIDEMLATTAGGIGRYTEELTRELIATAPRGVFVEGFVSASPETEYADIADRLPGLAFLHKSTLARRELKAAWQHGVTRLPGSGMLHAPSLLAPLGRHDRLNDGDQIVVTFHDTLAWSHPESLSPRTVAWHKAMAKRAQKHADAVVAPSHAVAEHLSELFDFGDRVRVISGAANPAIALPVDASERAEALRLPERYVLAIGISETLVQAMTRVDPTVSLALVGPASDDQHLGATIARAHLPASRVKALGPISDPDLAVALGRAALFVHSGIDEGFGMPVLDAFSLGTPVIHSDDPALLELSADAGIAVNSEEQLVEAITAVLNDARLAERLHYSGLDRSRAYTWRSTAEKVWQLHADL